MQASINNNKKLNCSINNNQKISCSVCSGNNIQADTCAKNDINANSTQRGPQGIPGEAATIQLGTVTTGAAGSDVIITNSGTQNAAVFNFTIPRGDRGEQGEQGIQGETGNGIESIELSSTSGNVDTYTVTYTNGETSSFTVTNGNGIVSIVKTSTSGLIDTYTITFDNGATTTFEVANGAKGDTGSAATISVGSTTTGAAGTSASVTNSGTSSAAVLDFVIPQGIQGEQGVSVTGVTLQSTSGQVKTYRMSFSNGTYFDYQVTDGADGGVTVDSELSTTSENPVQNKVITGALNEKQDTLTAGDFIEIKPATIMRVPSGYTQLTSIYSSGGAGIDTGLSGNIQWEITAMGNSPYPATRFLVSCANATGNSSWFGEQGAAWGYGSTQSTGIGVKNKVTITIDFNTNSCNITIDERTFSSSLASASAGNWHLFCSPSGSYYFWGEMFSAIARQGGVIVFDGVPAKRDSDDEVGLYDMISGNFFPSVTDTSFTVGDAAYLNPIISANVGDATISLTQYAITKGTFNTNAKTNQSISLNPTIAPKEVNITSLQNSSTQKTANSLLYLGSDDRIHSYTETNIPISLSYGMFVNSTAVSANSNFTWYYKGEKLSWTVPAALRNFTARQKVYAKCTYPDSNGNVYFVGVVGQANTTNTLEGGYTYYYLGNASSGTTTVALNVSGSHFISLDTDGNLTHIDGVEIAQPEVTQPNDGILTITQDGNTLGTFGANQSGNSTIDIPSSGNVQTGWADVKKISELGENKWYELAYGNGKYVTIGYDGYVSTSTDGTTWTTATNLLGANQWRNITFGNNKFVAIGQTGYISTSADGINWTTPSQNSSLGNNQWYGIAYGGGLFVATSNGGYVSTSADGATWTTAVQKSELGSRGWYVGFGNNKFVALSTNGYISTSTNGTDWATATYNSDLTSKSWQAIDYGNGTFVALGSNGYISRSANGTDWDTATQELSTVDVGWYGLAFGGDKFVTLGYKGDVCAYNYTIAELSLLKADTDLTNITDSAKVMMSKMGAYSPKFVDLTLGASGATYTAPATGYFSIYRISTAAGQEIRIAYPNANDSYAYTDGGHANVVFSTGTNQYIGFDSKLLKKGQQITIIYTMATANGFRFYYVEGSESEV